MFDYGLIIAGLLGLVVGSFLNVLIARYQELQTIIATRSHCPKCLKQIAWYDLVPLLSFALLRFRCRYCHERISWQYPLVELLSAAAFVHVYSLFGFSWWTVLYAAIFSLLLATSAVDWREKIIPDEFIAPAILLSLIVAVTRPTDTANLLMWGVLLAGGGLALLVIVSRERWMGSGDIGLGIIIGLLGGWLGAAVGLVVAFVTGSIVGLILMLLGRKGPKDSIPFGPFLLIGAYLAAFYGQSLALSYLTLVRFY